MGVETANCAPPKCEKRDREISAWDAAKMLGVCDQTIRNWIREGVLTARQERPGAHVHVSRQSVLDLIANMQAQLNTPHSAQTPYTPRGPKTPKTP
ncbi:MAG: helix-turn-helix domain-containing protein [Terriglobales bacterium]